MFFLSPFQLLDLCILDTGSLQFSYSILAASALYHMLHVKVEQVTGERLKLLADDLKSSYPCFIYALY